MRSLKQARAIQDAHAACLGARLWSLRSVSAVYAMVSFAPCWAIYYVDRTDSPRQGPDLLESKAGSREAPCEYTEHHYAGPHPAGAVHRMGDRLQPDGDRIS